MTPLERYAIGAVVIVVVVFVGVVVPQLVADAVERWARNRRHRAQAPAQGPHGVEAPNCVYDVTTMAQARAYVADWLTWSDAATLRRSANDSLWSSTCTIELARGCALVLRALDELVP